MIQQHAELAPENQPTSEELEAEYRELRPTLLRMMREWRLLRDPITGSPAMTHFLGDKPLAAIPPRGPPSAGLFVRCGIES
jgi:hypothetical protein